MRFDMCPVLTRVGIYRDRAVHYPLIASASLSAAQDARCGGSRLGFIVGGGTEIGRSHVGIEHETRFAGLWLAEIDNALC